MKRKDQLREEIIRELKAENGGSAAEIASIVDFQFAYVKDIISAGGYEGVRLPYLGKFHAKVLRIKYLTDAVIRRKGKQGKRSFGAKADPGVQAGS